MDEKLSKFLEGKDDSDVIYGSLNAPRLNTDNKPIDTIVSDGKIKDGSEYGAHIKCIESVSQSGNQVFYLYEKVGAVFATKKEDKPDLVLQGNMDLHGEQKFVQGYTQTKDGNEWISLSIYPKRENDV